MVHTGQLQNVPRCGTIGAMLRFDLENNLVYRFELTVMGDDYTRRPIKVPSWNSIYGLPKPSAKNLAAAIWGLINRRRKAKAEVKEAVWDALREVHGDYDRFPTIQHPVDVFAVAHVTGNRRRDTDNVGILLKFALDALVEYHVLEDDSDMQVDFPVPRIIRAKEPKVVLAILRAEEGNTIAIRNL